MGEREVVPPIPEWSVSRIAGTVTAWVFAAFVVALILVLYVLAVVAALHAIGALRG